MIAILEPLTLTAATSEVPDTASTGSDDRQHIGRPTSR
jgi:hypothetical protein